MLPNPTLIAFTTLCSYASGILIERQERRLIQRWICAANITLNLLVLCIFKYFNFKKQWQEYYIFY
mgnify:CR=1 FL=1